MTPFCRPAEPLKTYRGGRKKDVHFYIIRAILFLGAGAGLLLVPYEKFQSWFPKAPGPAAVKIAGVLVLLCGIAVLALSAVKI